MSDVWQIRSAFGTTEHPSAPLAFAEMGRLVLAGAAGVTFEKRSAAGAAQKREEFPEPSTILTDEGDGGQIRIRF